MRAELVNLATIANLSGGLVSGSTSLCIRSGANWPAAQSGVFRVLIDSEVKILQGASGFVFNILQGGAEGTIESEHQDWAAAFHLITAMGAKNLTGGVRFLSGSTYTFAQTDARALIVFNSSGGALVSGALPQSESGDLSDFGPKFYVEAINLGSGSTLSIAPASGTINGGAGITLTYGKGARIYSPGTVAGNYIAHIWQPSGFLSILSGMIQSGMIASGAVQGFFGATRHIASGTVGVFDFGSGAVIAGTVGSGAVQSGNVASGQIGNAHLALAAVGSGHIQSGAVWGLLGGVPHIASGSLTGFELGSGAIVSGRVASGQIGFGHLANGSVRSGTIGSGQVWWPHLGSGYFTAQSGIWADFTVAPPMIGLSGSFGGGGGVASGVTFTAVCAENISGVRAVNISQSGLARVAMASVSGRMPAAGVCFDNFASGATATIYVLGTHQVSSGMADYSGYLGQSVFVGRSGQVVSCSGSWNSGGFRSASGDLLQELGIILNSGRFLVN